MVAPLTALVDTEKFALVAPAGTVTLAGTVATAGLLLDSPTVTPPTGAVVLSHTVPLPALPPPMFLGFSVKDDSVASGRATMNVSKARAPPVLPNDRDRDLRSRYGAPCSRTP